MVLYKVRNNKITAVKTIPETKEYAVIKQVKKPDNICESESNFYLIYFIHNLEAWVIEIEKNKENI